MMSSNLTLVSKPRSEGNSTHASKIMEHPDLKLNPILKVISKFLKTKRTIFLLVKSVNCESGSASSQSFLERLSD